MKTITRLLLIGLSSTALSFPASAQICEVDTIMQNAPAQNFVTSNPDSTRYPLTHLLAADGSEVLHVTTGLVWKRCSAGQTWDQENHRCLGIPTRLSWKEALELAQTTASAEGNKPWRVPNIKEMVSIVDFQCLTPPFNLEVFPNTPASIPAQLEGGSFYGSGYWTSSPNFTPGTTTTVWWVDTHLGEIVGRSVNSGIKHFVRFVRSE